jgi:hypothetical protein
MTTLNKVAAKPAIVQPGALGYLLWVRRDLPPVYSHLAKVFPEVANFESTLKRQAAGLGDDTVDFTDTSFTPDTSTFDLAPAPIFIDAPEIPAISVPIDSSGSAAEAANSISGSTLSNIANTISAVLPSALKAATAVVNSQTASKTLATAQLQYSAAIAGKSPLLTGIVTTPNGTQYLSALNPLGNASDVLSTNVSGLPLWAWGLIGIGALGLIVATSGD